MDEPIAYVAVCGTGVSDPDTDALAYDVGRLLAEAGAILLCGGLDGVMAAACKGADSAGGLSVGLLPGTSRSEANEFLDIALSTGMGEMRNTLIVRCADAVIAIGGGWGTLSEIAFARKTDVPVFGIGTWDLGDCPDGIEEMEDARTAVEAALAVVTG